MSDKFVESFNIMGLPVLVRDKSLTETVNTVIPRVTSLEGKFPLNNSNIANETITSDQMATGSIDSRCILDGSVRYLDLAKAERISVCSGGASLVKKVVLIGDSYVHSDNGRHAFDEVLPTVAPTWDVISSSDSGCSFTAPGAQGFKMTDLVNNAANILGSGAADISYVIFCGGRNEVGGIASPSRPSDSLESAAEEAFSNAHTKFPNAKVCLFPCLYDWRLPNANVFRAIELITYAASVQNVWIANGCWSWGVGEPSWYLYPNDIHPNQLGSAAMCKKIYSAIENRDCNCFRTRQANVGNIAFFLNESGIQIVGEYTFDGSSNLIVSDANLPEWLRSRGGFNWYFAGYNPTSNTTYSTMIGFIPQGLAATGGTVMPSGQKVLMCANIPFTL